MKRKLLSDCLRIKDHHIQSTGPLVGKWREAASIRPVGNRRTVMFDDCDRTVTARNFCFKAICKAQVLR